MSILLNAYTDYQFPYKHLNYIIRQFSRITIFYSSYE